MPKCVWVESKEKDYYLSSCGGQYEFNNLSTPKENLFSFCPFCGEKLETHGCLFQLITRRILETSEKK